jgi:hypothetical protein
MSIVDRVKNLVKNIHGGVVPSREDGTTPRNQVEEIYQAVVQIESLTTQRDECLENNKKLVADNATLLEKNKKFQMIE